MSSVQSGPRSAARQPDENEAEGADEARGATPELTTDAMFHLLQNDRRRAALRHLRAVDAPVEVGDLAEVIAAREQDTTVDGLSSQQRQRVYISLYQTHLPKLDEWGVVEYRKNRGVVIRQPAAERLERYLLESTEETLLSGWPARYGTVVIVGVALVGASVLGIGGLSGTAAAILVLALLAVVTFWHVLEPTDGTPSLNPPE